MRRILNILYSTCAVLAGFFMVAMTLLVLAQAVGRLLGMVVPDANELAGFCVAALTFLALAPTLRDGGHIRVSLLLTKLPRRLRRLLEVWCLAVALWLSAYFAYWAVDLAIGSYRFHDVSSGVLAFPLWIPQAGMAFGLLVMSLCLSEILLDVLRGAAPPYAGKEDETASE